MAESADRQPQPKGGSEGRPHGPEARVSSRTGPTRRWVESPASALRHERRNKKNKKRRNKLLSLRGQRGSRVENLQKSSELTQERSKLPDSRPTAGLCASGEDWDFQTENRYTNGSSTKK